MQGSEDMNQMMTATLPKALSELAQSQQNIEQIAQYCKNAYLSDPDQNAVFGKTQVYLKDVLSNVAYHIHTVALHLTGFLQLQTKELDKLDLQIQSLTDRMKSVHDTAGATGLRSMEAARTYKRQPKMRKVDPPPPPTLRETPTLSHASSFTSPSIPARSESSVSSYSAPPPPSIPVREPLAPPPPSIPVRDPVPPPPPSLPVRDPVPPPPPSIPARDNAPPPPPPRDDYSGGFDLPPPPPPGPDDYLPPPPPNYDEYNMDLPPPPPPGGFDLPPPPPPRG